MTTGNLGLTDKEENQIVTFLQDIVGRFHQALPQQRHFTGACMKGGSAATQGNEFLIPTPPLPPCASAICGVAPVPGPKAISDNSLAHESPTDCPCGAANESSKAL